MSSHKAKKSRRPTRRSRRGTRAVFAVPTFDRPQPRRIPSP